MAAPYRLDSLPGAGLQGAQPAYPETEEDYIQALLAMEESRDVPEQEFSGGATPGFLERLGTTFRGGVPAPGGFLGGLASGAVGGLAAQGQKTAQARERFDQTLATNRQKRDEESARISRERRAELISGLRALQARKTPEQIEEEAYRGAVGRGRAEQQFPPRAGAEDRTLVDVVDPATGKRKLVLRSDAEGMEPGGSITDIKPPSQGEREQLVADIGMLDHINMVRGSFNREFVGPRAGRVGALQQMTGLGLGKGESGFRAQVAGLRNQIGKLRSGQAISESEAARLLEELPTVNDPSEVFSAKLDNFENLYRKIAETRRGTLAGTRVDVSGVPALPARARAPIVRDPETGQLVRAR